MFVLTIDQRHSRRSADRVPELLAALADVPCVSPFERTAGDEIQGMPDGPAAVRSALLAALRAGDWHCGVGVGPVEDGSYASGTRAGRGPAFLAAREAVEAAKSLASSVAVRAPEGGAPEGGTPQGGTPQCGTPDDAGRPGRGPGALARDCEAVWGLVSPLVQGRTAAQWRVVDAVDRSPTQAAAARDLDITPTSVSESLKLSAIREERAVYALLDRLLADCDAAGAAATTTTDPGEGN